VIAVDRDPSAPGFRYADRRAIVSTEDESGIERLASAERVQGLIAPGIDWPVAIAARVAERLSLPHAISPETAALSTSKLRQRERFAEAGVPQPEFQICSGPEEATAAAERIGFPCVIKAPDRQGQRGLTLVRSADEVAEAVRVALDAARTATLLVEEHVPGLEVTVNAFSSGGHFHPLTVTDRLTAPLPTLVMPSMNLPFKTADASVMTGGAKVPHSGPANPRIEFEAPPPKRASVIVPSVSKTTGLRSSPQTPTKSPTVAAVTSMGSVPASANVMLAVGTAAHTEKPSATS